jgi:predicted dehydrogenase
MTILTRRKFLAAAGGAAMAAGLSGGRARAANDKIDIAMIGVGGQGKSDLRSAAHYGHNIVAICDADWRMAGSVFEAYPKAKKWRDYREMLDKQRNIDAVVIATPDHHHAFASMAAMRHGKHVYCEKPLTHSVYEARTLAETAAGKKKLATQMGNQGQADDHVRVTAEILRAGMIGPVREVHLWTDRPIWPQGVERPAAETPHEEMKWDLWIGAAPERPYSAAYHPFKWRGWWDFGTGALGDMGCHMFHPVFYEIELGSPLSVEATSTAFNAETYPLKSTIKYEFPARGAWPACTLTWYDGGNKPPRPAGLPEGEEFAPTGMYYVGDKGVLFRGDHGDDKPGRILTASGAQEITPPTPTLERSPGHWEEWFRAIKGGPAPGANFQMAGRVTETVLIGNAAIKAGKKLEWDAAGMTFKNAPDATQFLRREYRKGWKL